MELKSYDPTYVENVFGGDTEVYLKDDVDERIKELEAENASLRNSKETYSEMLLESIKQLAKEEM